jgi:hypothetical protein
MNHDHTHSKNGHSRHSCSALKLTTISMCERTSDERTERMDVWRSSPNELYVQEVSRILKDANILLAVPSTDRKELCHSTKCQTSGDSLFTCSYPTCRDQVFLLCHGKIPVARQWFHMRHHHSEEDGAAGSATIANNATQQQSTLAPWTTTIQINRYKLRLCHRLVCLSCLGFTRFQGYKCVDKDLSSSDMESTL